MYKKCLLNYQLNSVDINYICNDKISLLYCSLTPKLTPGSIVVVTELESRT